MPTPVAVGSVITTIIVQSTAGVMQSNVPITFGQPFAFGELPALNAAVELRAPDGSIVPCQLNVKKTNSDGSVRHAILSAIIPALDGASAISYGIVRRASPLSGAAPVPSDFSGLNATVLLTDTGINLSGPVSGTAYTADAASVLAAGTYETWLSGPIASEWIVRAPLKTSQGVEHPDLHARFSIRVYAGQSRAKIDYIIENNWAQAKVGATSGTAWDSVSNSDKVYRVTLKAGTDNVYTRSVNGKIFIDFVHPSGTYDGNKTGLANNSTVYTASVVVNGVAKNLSVTGSAAQTYASLRTLLNNQLGIATVVRGDLASGVEIVSSTLGTGSSVRVTNLGTLFSAMRGTGYSSSTTTPITYTATVTVNGSTAINLSAVGNQAQFIGQLCAILNEQMAGVATAMPVSTGNGVEFRSVATGQTSDVVITTPGTMFKSLAPVILHRPVDGDEVAHYARTRWKKTFWRGTEPQVHLVHNKAYLTDSLAVPKYQEGLTISADLIANNLATMLANEDIGQNGLTSAGMGAPGYAPGIGVLPEWTANWIVSQHKDAKYVMLKQADLMGSWPVFFRDRNTDRPISFTDFPYATIQGSSSDSRNPTTLLSELFPAKAASTLPDSRLVPDVSHHPDFNFVPYMVTGDHYYMEGMLFYQRFTIISQNPASTFRDGQKGLIWKEQVRGQAWSIRTMAHTLYLLPDNHPLLDDVAYVMDQNRIWYEANYLAQGSQYNNPLGFIVSGAALVYNSKTSVAPWMDDFVTASMGRTVELGFTAWRPMFNYKARTVIGRMTSGADFCWQVGASYNMRLKDDSTAPLYTTWNQVYLKSFNTAITSATCGTQAMATAIAAVMASTPATINVLGNRPSEIGGYPSNMQPAAAYVASLGATGGEDAWLVYEGRSVKPNYSLGPQFAIVPRTLSATPPDPDPDPNPDPDPEPETPPTGVIKMAIADRVKEISNTTGTGAFALGGAVSSDFRAFNPAIAVGSTTPYVARHVSSGQWEIGIGTLSASNVLARSPTASSNNGQLVNFIEGGLEIGCDLTAAFMNRFAAADDAAITVVANLTSTSLMVEENGRTKRIKISDFLTSVGTEAKNLETASNIAGGDQMIIIQNGVEKIAPLTAIAAAISALSGAPVDTTSPTLSSPSGTSTGTTTATGSVSTNEATGTLYYLFATTSTATAAAVKAASSKAVTATGTQSVSATGLTAATTYYVHFLHRDAAGNESTVASSASFTTTAAGTPATAITMSGPTSGTVSTASSNFNIGVSPVGGTISGTVVVTPSDSGGGGTFTPSTVSLTTASPTATFTYTPSSTAGARTISVTNNGGLTNPANITYTSIAADTTPPTATSAVVANGAPTTVSITMSEAMNTSFVPAASAFTVDGHTVSSVAISGSTINLTVTPAFVNGEAARTASYSQPGTNNARDLAGNLLANFSGLAITNNVPAQTVYTISPYNSNAVKTSVDGTNPSGGSSMTYKYFSPGSKVTTNIYWNISPTPGSAFAGWGTSSTDAPPIITQNANSAAGGNNNGMTPMTAATSPAWAYNSALNVLNGGGTVGPFFFWVKPVDGAAVCLNPKDGNGNFIGTYVTGA